MSCQQKTVVLFLTEDEYIALSASLSKWEIFSIRSVLMFQFLISMIIILAYFSESLSQMRYSLVVILELNSVSEVQYKDMMTDRW